MEERVERKEKKMNHYDVLSNQMRVVHVTSPANEQQRLSSED